MGRGMVVLGAGPRLAAAGAAGRLGRAARRNRPRPGPSVIRHRVGSIGRAGAEHAGFRPGDISARTHGQYVAPRPVEPGQEDDVGAGPQVLALIICHPCEMPVIDDIRS